jgi:hypothetical protein
MKLFISDYQARQILKRAGLCTYRSLTPEMRFQYGILLNGLPKNKKFNKSFSRAMHFKSIRANQILTELKVSYLRSLDELFAPFDKACISKILEDTVHHSARHMSLKELDISHNVVLAILFKNGLLNPQKFKYES